ncbi:MAG TPA: aldo/keto reductase [Solirubrobacteraceae bacterium]|nr:aldo/keto reductase [Solirubrobacteraceae bacterium]
MTTISEQIPHIALGEGVQIPQLGFGVFQVPPRQTAGVVAQALQAGYRHIDTAAAYRNEQGVGQAIGESGLSREQVFVTTKCFNDDQGYEQAQRACSASLERLGFEFVDLYLIHWPVPAHDLYAETWRAFVALHRQGRAHAIGVSNFKEAHLRRVIEDSGVAPSINQVELHPYFQQRQLRELHAELGIVTEAWSPLAQGAVLEDPTIAAIAGEHGKSAGQVVIRWHLQLGNVVIPKSVTPARIRENIDVFDFELDDAQMEAIAGLDRGERTGPDPDTFVRP